MRARIIVGAGFALVLAPAMSVAADLSPRETLQDFFSRATAAVSGTADEQHARKGLREITSQMFEGGRAARRALGPEWDRRTARERENFARLFAQALRQGYVKIIGGLLPRDRVPAVGFT